MEVRGSLMGNAGAETVFGTVWVHALPQVILIVFFPSLSQKNFMKFSVVKVRKYSVFFFTLIFFFG